MAQKNRPQAETLYGLPQPLQANLFPVIIAERDPTSGDTGYPFGQSWINKSNNTAWVLTSVAGGAAAWQADAGGSVLLSSLTGDTGTATPTAGNILIAGGTNITTAASGSTVTVNLDATLAGLTSVTSTSFVTSSATLGTTWTANSFTPTGSNADISLLVNGKGTGGVIHSRGLVGGDITIEATNTDNTNAASRAGFEAAVGGTSAGDPYFQSLISGGQVFSWGIDNSTAADDWVLSKSATLGTSNQLSIDGTSGALTTVAGITATAGDISAASGNLSASGTVTGGTGVTATTGNVTATAGAVNAGTSMTATLGDITATAGNFVLAGVATQLQMNGGAVTDFIGTATLTNGTVTIANTNIAANDRIFLSRTVANASTALGMLSYTISAGVNFVVTALQTATPAATETNDVSSFAYFIVRET